MALKGSIATVSDRPVVSVVIPAWNAGRSIQLALESVLRDPAPALECIVVDDGSTDDTAAVVGRLADADPRVRLLRAPVNEGVSMARNRALGVARGTWLTFLDADDRLVPGGLAAMLRATAADDVLAVVGQRVWTDGRAAWVSASYDIPDISTPGRKSIASHPGLMYYASATGKLFHRSLTTDLGFEGRVLGDQPWTIRALLRAGSAIEVIGDVVYEWRRPAGESSATITSAKRLSARLAAEAARVAVGALADVTAEAELRLPAPADRARVVMSYLERLVSADLAGPVARAVARNDDGADELFAAVTAVLATAPPGMVASSAAVVAALVRDPVARWPGVREPARGAYLSFLVDLLRTYPGLGRRLARLSPVRLGLAILRRGDSPVARRLAGLAFMVQWPIGVLDRLHRRRRRRVDQAAGARASPT